MRAHRERAATAEAVRLAMSESDAIAQLEAQRSDAPARIPSGRRSWAKSREPWDIYALVLESGQVLYVGKTRNSERRKDQHRRTRRFNKAAFLLIDRSDDTCSGHDLEKAWILRLWPVYNVKSEWGSTRHGLRGFGAKTTDYAEGCYLRDGSRYRKARSIWSRRGR